MSVIDLLKPVLRNDQMQGLSAFLSELDIELTHFARSQEGFLARMAEYVLTGSGKRVRPALVYVCAGFGTADLDAVKRTALGVELLHIASLIHDDLVDQASLRRQKPTVAAQFGDGAAVLLGDYVYAQAFERLGLAGRMDVISLFTRTAVEMASGEIAQLERRGHFDLTEKEYLSFLHRKTATLMAASCRAGSLLAGLPKEQAEALHNFGQRIGMAFQIVDDLMDLEGEESVAGKTLRTDLVHGKMTLPLLRYRDRLPAAERKAFFEMLSHPDNHMKALVERLQRSGVMDECRAQVKKLVSEGELSIIEFKGPARDLLLGMSKRLTVRNS